MLCDVSYFLKAVQLKVSSWRPTRCVLEVCIGLAQWFVEMRPSLRHHNGIEILSSRGGVPDKVNWTCFDAELFWFIEHSHTLLIWSQVSPPLSLPKGCVLISLKGPRLLPSAVEMSAPVKNITSTVGKTVYSAIVTPCRNRFDKW